MDDLNNSIATTYDKENRGIPRLFARYITSLAPQITSDSVIHDNACGPAVVTSEILSHISSDTTPSIAATDISPMMVTVSEDIIKTNKWNYVDAAVMDSQNLSFEDDTFSHSFTNFIVPSGPAVLSEIYRTLNHGGTALFTEWKFQGFVSLMRRCGETIRPSSESTKSPIGQWITEDALREQFEAAGFQKQDINVQSHREYLRFEDLDDLISLTEGPFGKFLVKDWDAEEVQRLPEVVKRVLTAEELGRKSLEMVGWIVVAKKM